MRNIDYFILNSFNFIQILSFYQINSLSSCISIWIRIQGKLRAIKGIMLGKYFLNPLILNGLRNCPLDLRYF